MNIDSNTSIDERKKYEDWFHSHEPFFPTPREQFEYFTSHIPSSSNPISEDFETLYNVKHIECSFAEEQIKNLTEENERLKGEDLHTRAGLLKSIQENAAKDQRIKELKAKVDELRGYLEEANKHNPLNNNF